METLCKRQVLIKRSSLPEKEWSHFLDEEMLTFMIIILNLDSLQNSHIKEMKLCIGI